MSDSKKKEKWLPVMFDFDDEEVMKAFRAWWHNSGEQDFYRAVDMVEPFDVVCSSIEDSRDFMIRKKEDEGGENE